MIVKCTEMSLLYVNKALWNSLLVYGGLFLLAWILILLLVLVSRYNTNPFSRPKIIIKIDISGRKKPSHKDLIEQWIINHQDYDFSKNYKRRLSSWEQECEYYLKNHFMFKKRRREFFEETREEVKHPDYGLFCFVFYRRQTRYKQINYTRYPYEVKNEESTIRLSLRQILKIDEELKKINYETTTEKYNAFNQRSLVTRELREQIMVRDNYTCQLCGKYMPDEVGLHIDHIVSIKNGGKTVASNLWVLCDKCNLSKGSRNA